MNKIYLICPVRNCPEEIKKFLDEYVEKLESKGNIVHYPPRDVVQTQSGLNICSEHSQFMATANEVHIYWDSESGGSVFDLGMAFLKLYNNVNFKLVIINKNEIKRTQNKSFTNMLLDLAEFKESQQKIEQDDPFIPNLKVKVVNIYFEDYDVYIGRPGKGKKGEFGNHHSVYNICPICKVRHTREEAISIFRKWFYSPELTATIYRDLVKKKIKPGDRLGCFCSPKQCHGDIIAKYVNNGYNFAEDDEIQI